MHVDADARLNQPLPTGTRYVHEVLEAGDAMRRGTQFHALMERLTDGADVEVEADTTTLRRVLNINDDDLESLTRMAHRLINDTSYRRYFDAEQYVRAANEAPLITEGGDVLRVDRLVEFDDEVCVLDYKTGTLDNTNSALIDEYREQVQSYCVHVARAFPGKRAHGLILFSGGGSIEITP